MVNFEQLKSNPEKHLMEKVEPIVLLKELPMVLFWELVELRIIDSLEAHEVLRNVDCDIEYLCLQLQFQSAHLFPHKF